jgi:hypothetical protein
MSRRIIGAAAIATVTVFAGSASAACVYKPFQYQPEKNGGVVVTSAVGAGSFCAHDFQEKPGYQFESVTIDRPPEHGALTQTEATRFVFTPSRRFSGKDSYVFKICAKKGDERGCSTIAFVATVHGKDGPAVARERADMQAAMRERRVSSSD